MPTIEYRRYNPRSGARQTIDQANLILHEAHQDGWPSMTLRQLYYQFVARGFIANAISEYKRLGRIITDARYGGLIDWTAIEDAGRTSFHFPERPTAEDVLQGIEHQLRIDPWQTQDHYVEVWVEKQALEATIARPCSALQTPYMACKGYLSASEAWRAARRFQRALDNGKQPVLLHLGDHDPSGLDMTRDNEGRLNEFLGSPLEVRRIALNMDQVQKYGPPPNPAKEKDSRFQSYRNTYGSESWELDALKQNVIGELITEELKTFIDQEQWDEIQALQASRRLPLASLIQQWPNVEDLVTRVDDPLYRLQEYDVFVNGAQYNTPSDEFLMWVANRLVEVYGEHPNVDFVMSLKGRVEELQRIRHHTTL